jgi:hypothetical protein
MIKKFLTLLVTSFSLLSCSNNLSINEIKNKKEIVVNIDTNKFSLKSSSNHIPRKLLTDIKYIEVYLTDNNSEPFSNQNLVTLSEPETIENISDAGNLTARFSLPNVDGTYYAVAAAFDNDDINITEPNLSLVTLDNKWSVSSNSVQIVQNDEVYSSDSSLNLTLQLQNESPVKIETQINHIEGSDIMPSLEVM